MCFNHSKKNGLDEEKHEIEEANETKVRMILKSLTLFQVWEENFFKLQTIKQNG